MSAGSSAAQDLIVLRLQEQALITLLSKASNLRNSLKIEQMQLRRLVEEKDGPDHVDTGSMGAEPGFQATGSAQDQAAPHHASHLNHSKETDGTFWSAAEDGEAVSQRLETSADSSDHTYN